MTPWIKIIRKPPFSVEGKDRTRHPKGKICETDGLQGLCIF